MSDLQSTVEEIKGLIRSENIRKIIFLSPNPSSRGIQADIYGSIYKLLYLAFYIFYLIFINEKQNGKQSNLLNDRVRNSFEKLYKSYLINDDMIFFILVELQIESAKSENGNIGLHEFIDNSINLYYWKERLKFASINPRPQDGRDELLRNLRDTIKSFPMFRRIEAGFNDDELVFTDNDLPQINSHQLLTLNTDNNSLLMAYKFEFENESNRLDVFYRTIDIKPFYAERVEAGKKLRIIYNKILREKVKKKFVSHQDSLLISKLYGEDFDRIRILSLAISDAIQDNEKNHIISQYGKSDDFEMLFRSEHKAQWKKDEDKSSNYEDDKSTEYSYEDSNLTHSQSLKVLNWDNIITILVIEVGPSELLSLILDSSEFIFNKIMDNIAVRTNQKVDKKSYLDPYIKERSRLLDKFLSDPFSSSIQRDKWLDEHKKDLMIKSIIRFVAMKIDEAYPPMVESLPMMLNHYKEICYSNKPTIKKLLEINYIFENMFKFLNMFYNGLIAYAETSFKEAQVLIEEQSKITPAQTLKEELPITNNGQISQKIDQLGPKTLEGYSDRKRQIQLKCETAFQTAAEQWVEGFNKEPKALGVLLPEFEELCRSVLDPAKDKGKAVESLIGRRHICDLEKFDRIVKDDKKKKQVGLVKLINSVKHGESIRYLSDQQMNDYFDRGLKIFYLFMDFEGRATNNGINHNVTHVPVFPFVIQFTMNKKTKDGYSVNSYSMHGVDADISDIKLLSSKTHQPNGNYYCIPNISSSTSRWWIEPFIIECAGVNESFSKLDKNSKQKQN